jgi:hypothetical protein
MPEINPKGGKSADRKAASEILIFSPLDGLDAELIWLGS